MLGHLIEGLHQCRRVDAIVLATSAEPSDDPVAAFALQSGISCHRGPLEDVARRVLDAARSANADAVVRISGDSPLLDPRLVDQGVDLFHSDSTDLATNVAKRTFPKGQSVEVIACESLARAVGGTLTAHQREHVTPVFYENPAKYSIRSFEAARPRPDVQLSIDELEDFERWEAILAILGQPPWQAGWEACVRASDRVQARA